MSCNPETVTAEIEPTDTSSFAKISEDDVLNWSGQSLVINKEVEW